MDVDCRLGAELEWYTVAATDCKIQTLPWGDLQAYRHTESWLPKAFWDTEEIKFKDPSKLHKSECAKLLYRWSNLQESSPDELRLTGYLAVKSKKSDPTVIADAEYELWVQRWDDDRENRMDANEMDAKLGDVGDRPNVFRLAKAHGEPGQNC